MFVPLAPETTFCVEICVGRAAFALRMYLCLWCQYRCHYYCHCRHQVMKRRPLSLGKRGRNSVLGRHCHSTRQLRTFLITELALWRLILQTNFVLPGRMLSTLESSSVFCFMGHCLPISAYVMHLRKCYTKVLGCSTIIFAALAGACGLGLSSCFLRSDS